MREQQLTNRSPLVLLDDFECTKTREAVRKRFPTNVDIPDSWQRRLYFTCVFFTRPKTPSPSNSDRSNRPTKALFGKRPWECACFRHGLVDISREQCRLLRRSGSCKTKTVIRGDASRVAMKIQKENTTDNRVQSVRYTKTGRSPCFSFERQKPIPLERQRSARNAENLPNNTKPCVKFFNKPKRRPNVIFNNVRVYFGKTNRTSGH